MHSRHYQEYTWKSESEKEDRESKEMPKFRESGEKRPQTHTHSWRESKLHVTLSVWGLFSKQSDRVWFFGIMELDQKKTLTVA